MNLIDDPWIPVRRVDGDSRRIRPHELTITDNPVVALDAPRPDFNGALAQFLIGLLQTVCAPANEEEWEDWLWSPPVPDTLAQRFAPLAPCFQLDGDGPRFMQDFDVNMEGNNKPVSALLIEAPGEETLRNNKDHFVKRELIQGLCPVCAAMALFALQINAPKGGAGHRTSLRGGGPLTTLLIFDHRSNQNNFLWRDLWLNILLKNEYLTRGYEKTNDQFVWFPWLYPTRTSEKGQKTTPVDVHPAVAYWATPRRIYFNFKTAIDGMCDLCGVNSEKLLQHYTTRNYGTRYTDWIHSLSPYQRKPNTSEWIAQRPRSDGINYRYWSNYVFENPKTNQVQQVARVVSAFQKRFRILDKPSGQFLVWAFGYNMDDMTARCWYEARLPLFELKDESKRSYLAEFAQQWVEASDEARNMLFFALKKAWFKRPKDVKGDMSAIQLAFSNQTESDFYQGLRTFAEVLQTDRDLQDTQQKLNQEWYTHLVQQALALFDQWATAGEWEYENPHRLADAYHMLRRELYSNALKSKLGLAPPPDLDSKNRKGKKRKNP